MLARLGIRQKLSLLLTLPLIAVLVTTLPFVAERIDDARAAAATARAAQAARDLGVLVQGLQQERLLALGFLATRQLDPSALVTQVQTVNDDAERLRDEPDTGPAIARADAALTAL